MQQGIIRKLDELGRLIIPQEYRGALGWNENSKIFVTREGDRLTLQTYPESCFICGNEDQLKEIGQKRICKRCLKELNAED